ncbi:MAG: hypothetical protein RBT87_07235 [bacterium]|jgi:hypothetical protein|nr:hypothetical protein [bacterium]
MGVKKIIFLIAILYSLSIFGNAEPIDIKSSLKLTGNLVALQKSDIEIKKENLNIQINGVMADIEVNYTYFNKGKSDTIFLAFPVDFEIDMFDSRSDPTHHDVEIIKISVNGKDTIYDHIIERGYTCSDGDCSSYVPLLSPNLLYERDGVIIRRWYVTKVEFTEKKKTEVSIKYRIKAFGNPSVYSGNPMPTMDNRKVVYDFSPAQYFGMGKADEMEIVINTNGITSVGGKVEKISPSFFKEKSKGVFKYSGKDFDFRKTPNLLIEYDVKDLEMFNYFKQNRKTNNNLPIQHRAVSSSINDKKYGIKNLFDGKHDTAWCFKGGKEQFVEIELMPPLAPHHISIMNGYLKSSQTYEENGKVTEFEVITDCTEKDNCVYCEKLEFEKNYKPDIPLWNDIYLNNPFPANRMIWAINQSSYLLKKPCKIKILIKETTKGKKSDDVCISEIFLM